MLFGVEQLLLEVPVEAFQQRRPDFFTILDVIELSLEPRRIGRVKDVRKVGDQQISDNQADFRRHKLAGAANPDLTDIFTLLDRINDGGVSGRTANPPLFQNLDQRCLVETWRRFGEVLLRLDLTQIQLLPRVQVRQLILQGVVVLVLGVLGFFVNFQETIELEDRPGHAEVIAPGVFTSGFRLHFYGRLVEQRGQHLRGNKALPDEPVQL